KRANKECRVREGKWDYVWDVPVDDAMDEPNYEATDHGKQSRPRTRHVQRLGGNEPDHGSADRNSGAGRPKCFNDETSEDNFLNRNVGDDAQRKEPQGSDP